jgi:hypothetical protein
MRKLHTFSALTLIVGSSAFPLSVLGQTTPDSSKAYTGLLVASGRVVGPDSKPQPGVPVEVSGPQGKIVAFTDENGIWYLYNSPPGEYLAQPAHGLMTQGRHPAAFTVEKPDWFNRIVGEKKPAYVGEFRLDQDFKQ